MQIHYNEPRTTRPVIFGENGSTLILNFISISYTLQEDDAVQYCIVIIRILSHQTSYSQVKSHKLLIISLSLPFPIQSSAMHRSHWTTTAL